MTINQSRSFWDLQKSKTAPVLFSGRTGWTRINSQLKCDSHCDMEPAIIFVLQHFQFPYCNCRSSVTTPPEFEHFALSGIHRELVNILKEIQVISNKIRNDDEAASVENDWKFAAMVLDRLCLITFSLFTILATIGVLIAAPHVIVK